jgi:hypothetical protein
MCENYPTLGGSSQGFTVGYQQIEIDPTINGMF